MKAVMIPDIEEPTEEINSILYKKLNSLTDLIKLLESKSNDWK